MRWNLTALVAIAFLLTALAPTATANHSDDCKDATYEPSSRGGELQASAYAHEESECVGAILEADATNCHTQEAGSWGPIDPHLLHGQGCTTGVTVH